MIQENILHEESPLSGVRGWLLLLCLSLTVFSPLFMIIIYVQIIPYLFSAFDQLNILGPITIVDLVISAILMIFSIYAGISLWRKRPNAVYITKWFLLIYLAYGSITFLFGTSLHSWSGLVPAANSIQNGISTIIYFTIWFSYLSNSTRVKATYKMSDADQISEVNKKLSSTKNYFDLFTKKIYGINLYLIIGFFCASMLSRIYMYTVYSVEVNTSIFPLPLVWVAYFIKDLIIAVLFLSFSYIISRFWVFSLVWGITMLLSTFGIRPVRQLIESKAVDFSSLLQLTTMVDIFLYGVLFAVGLILSIRLFGVRVWALILGIAVPGLLMRLYSLLIEQSYILYENIALDLIDAILFGVLIFAGLYIYEYRKNLQPVI